MNISSIGFQTDVMLRAMSGAEVTDRGDHLVVRTPDNPGFRWGNFILVADWADHTDAGRWLAAFHDAFPDATHVAIGLDSAGISDPATDGVGAAFEGAGLSGERNIVLTAGSLPAGSLPAGSLPAVSAPTGEAAIRQLQGDGDWHAAVALRHELDGDDPGERLFGERKLASCRALTEEGLGAWFGAFVGARMVAGLGVFSDGSGLARYQDVDTHPDYQRRGLATALLLRAARFATNVLGAQTLVIAADPEYHAIELYRKVGFVDLEQLWQFERA